MNVGVGNEYINRIFGEVPKREVALPSIVCREVVLTNRYHMPSLKRVSTALIMLVVFGRAARSRLFRLTYTQKGASRPSPSPHLYKIAFSVRFTIYVQRK
jgi:hypothetical protein